MTRNGKIARLPREIREDLNWRLDNGEPGVRVIEWLNGLPEVKKVLEEDFEGQPISDANLTQWKNGGFLDWRAQKEARLVIQQWQIESPRSNAQSPKSEEGATGSPESGEMAEALTTALMAHYAVALQSSSADTTEGPGERMERLGKSLKDMARLRHYELARERLREHVRIGEEWVALERERLELERAKLSHKDPGTEAKPPGLSHEEKAEIVKQMVREAKARVQLREDVQ